MNFFVSSVAQFPYSYSAHNLQQISGLRTEVYNIINSLNLHKASGHDDIPSFFLRLGNEVLSHVLSVYFGLVFDIGLFPQIFKTAKVIKFLNLGVNNKLTTIDPFLYFRAYLKSKKN